MPGQGLIIAPGALAHFCAADYAIKLTANACIALCSSTNAVSFSSARTTKRFLRDVHRQSRSFGPSEPTFHHEKFVITDANTGMELKR